MALYDAFYENLGCANTARTSYSLYSSSGFLRCRRSVFGGASVPIPSIAPVNYVLEAACVVSLVILAG